jgi:hypothetical protein
MERKEAGRPSLHKKHGRLGRSFAHFRDNLPGDTYAYSDVRERAAEIIAAETGCDKDCILAQMDNYHISTTGATGSLRKSRQPRKDGDRYHKRHVTGKGW